VSDIFKKVTSIEPVDEDALEAIKRKGPSPAPRRSLLRPLPEDLPEADPVPEFITRETDRPVTQVEPPLEKAPFMENPQPAPVEAIQAPAPAAAPIAAAPIALTAAQEYAPSTAWMKWAGIAAVLIWLGASFAYMYGFFDLGRKWTDLTPIQIAGLILAILLPAILLGLLFYALRQLSKISAQSHDLARAAYALSSPDDTVIAKTAIMSKAVKAEIESVDARIDQALARMNTLESVIKEQTTGIDQATAATAQTTDEISSRLSTQRLALEAIAGTFDNRMAMLSSTLDERQH